MAATEKKEVKQTPVKKVTKSTEKKTTSKSATAKVEAVKPIKKTDTTKKEAVKPTAVKKVESKDDKKTDTTKKEAAKVAPKKPVVKPAAKKPSTKVAYHVSKRDGYSREWKVFIQGSSKVIKIFSTQAEALEYATQLCKNKNDGSYVVLHGVDGKIRKF